MRYERLKHPLIEAAIGRAFVDQEESLVLEVCERGFGRVFSHALRRHDVRLGDMKHALANAWWDPILLLVALRRCGLPCILGMRAVFGLGADWNRHF